MGQKTALGSLLKAIGNSGQGKVVPGWGAVPIAARFFSRLERKLNLGKPFKILISKFLDKLFLGFLFLWL